MKRKMSILSRGLFIALSILMISAIMVSASPLAAATTKQLSTNFTLVNLGTADAEVIVNYVKSDGSAWAASSANSSFVVPGNFGQKIVAQYFDSTLTTGQGSAIVSSSAQLGAVVQIIARNQVASSGAYSGISEPSDTVYVPLAQARKVTASGISNAQILIQNVDTTASQTVSVQLIPSKNADGSLNGNAHTESGILIQPGATFNYDLSSETDLNSNWSGAAVVKAEAGKKVAVVVNLFAGANTLTTYNAFATEMKGNTWSIPQFTSRLGNGLSTSVSVQNLSNSTMGAGAVVMDCVSSISTPATFQLTNAAAFDSMQGYAFNPVGDTSIPGNWSGACTLSAPGDVVVMVTLRRPGLSDDAAAYEAFNVAQSTDTKVVFPLMSKQQANGFATVATIQNLDTSSAAQVRLTYTPSADYSANKTPIVFEKEIPAGGNIQQNLRTTDVSQVPVGWFGTLLVESIDSTPKNLVGYVQLTNIKVLPGDNAMAHDAFSLP